MQVALAVQQAGFVRAKRGYKQIRGIPVPEVTAHQKNEKTKELPNDPLYSKQWYIVSKTANCFDRSIISHINTTARCV